MTFGFMLPIALSADSAIFFALSGRALENSFPVDGHMVTVKPNGKTDEAGSHGIVVTGAGFATADVATEIGHKARKLLLAAGAIRGIGMHTSTGEDIEDPNSPGANLLLRQHYQRLNVYVEAPGRDFVSITGSATQGQAISEVLKVARVIKVDAADQIRISAELYGLSKFLDVPRARFLTLMSAIEVQLLRVKRPATELALIERFIAEVNKAPTGSSPTLISALGNLKHISIGTAMREHVAHYLSADDAQFCETCNGWRNQLSHAGASLPGLEGAVERLSTVVSNLISRVVGC